MIKELTNKYKKLYIIGIATGIALYSACTGCTGENSLFTQEKVQFSGVMAQGSVELTKATDNNTDPFADGSTMGIYAYKSDKSTFEPNGANNEYVSSNQIFAHNGDNPLYWPTKGNLNIIAYSPYNSAVTTSTNSNTIADINYPVTNIADQKSNLATDILFAKETDIPGNHAPIKLIFEHVLSKLNIVLEGSFGMEFNNPEVLIHQLQTKATVCMKIDGASIQSLSEPTSIAPFTLSAESRKHELSALIIPQTISFNTQTEFVSITNQGDKYSFKIDPGNSILTSNKLKFEAGKEYTLTLTLNNKEAEIKNALVEIKEWSDGGSATGSGEAQWPER